MEKKSAHRGLRTFFERLSVQEKIDFARHLAIVIKAGLPLIDGLRIIKNQVTSKTLSEILEQLILDIEKGQSLADGLSAHRHIFGDFFINIVKVGETSGTLAQNLVYLAEELKKSKALRSKIKSAMIYPIVILVATIAITGFLTFVVFPKIMPVFTGLNIELPLTTRILLEVLEFFRNFGLYVIIGLILLSIGFKVGIKFAPVKYFFDRVVFMIPVISGLVIYVNMANFTRILGLLLKSGIRIVEAVTITSNTFDNSVYQRALLNSTEQIKKGEQLAEYLEANRKFFPLLLSGMIKIGENTGNLEENLFYLSDYYTEEIDNKIHALTTLLEPLLLLIMGLLVGFIAISIIMPIYSISQGLSS